MHALRAGAGRTVCERMGPGQRVFPAHQLPGLQHSRRHRRGKRGPRRCWRSCSTSAIRPNSTSRCIRQRVETVLDRGDFDYELGWRLSGQPFLTPAGELVDAARRAITEIAGHHRTVHQRRHLGRPLYRAYRRAGTGTWAAQRHDSPGQRVRVGSRPGPAVGRLSAHTRKVAGLRYEVASATAAPVKPFAIATAMGPSPSAGCGQASSTSKSYPLGAARGLRDEASRQSPQLRLNLR